MKKYRVDFYGGFYPLYVQAKNLHSAKVQAGIYASRSRNRLEVASIREITEVE